MCRDKVEAFWAAHDKNGDGILSADELRGDLKSSGQCKMSSDAVDAMFNELGIQAGGNITKQAFFEKFENQRKIELKKVFDRMDKDKSGKLSGQELMAVLVAENLYNQDDVKALFGKCKDTDGDGLVSLQEFMDAAF